MTLSNIMRYFLVFISFCCAVDKVTYVSIERPVLTYNNPKYMPYVNVSSRRRDRSDPIHYFEINFKIVIPMNNSLAFDFYFYEFLTNQYKRSFVEMHFKLCNMVKNDVFFGTAFRAAGMKGTCPFPPGDYNLKNMTIPTGAIPRSFPFRKGRIECNITFLPTKELIYSGYTDMELKTMRVGKSIQ